MNFKEELAEKIRYTESIITEFLPKEEGYQKIIMEAMNYSVNAGGKRLRPIMMHECYLLFGGRSKIIEPFMAAIEMIHTYSLVHDDLPAMDNDDYRRGRKTTHIVYGEDIGILAGDALLNYAFETVGKAFLLEPDNQNLGKAFALLAEKAGIYGMIGGQTVDVTATEEYMTKDKLNFIYELKTGALIEASMMVGAIVAGADNEQIETVKSIAHDVGIAFQIQDDILDVISSTAVLGKPIHSDEKNKKTTYVTLEGIDKAKEDVRTLSQNALHKLSSFSDENEFLYKLIQFLINREK